VRGPAEPEREPEMRSVHENRTPTKFNYYY
jgi:hypothetical protein